MRRLAFTLLVAIAVSAFAVTGWSQTIKVLDPASIQGARVSRAASLLTSPPPVPNFTDEQRQHLSGDATNFFYGKWRAHAGEAGGAADALQGVAEGRASTPLAPHNAAGLLKTLPTVNNRKLDLLTIVDTESETTVATAGGITLVGFNSSAEFVNNNSFSGWSRSLDGGKTFTEIGGLPQLTFTTCGSASDTVTPAGDPVIVADKSGNFYYSTLAEGSSGASLVLIYKSADGGLTFNLLTGAETCGGAFLDKEFLAIDPVGGPVVV